MHYKQKGPSLLSQRIIASSEKDKTTVSDCGPCCNENSVLGLKL